MRPIDERIYGRITLELMDQACCTSEITANLDENLTYIRDHLIRMHHLLLIEPIAVREEDDQSTAFTYYQDVVWILTKHARDHAVIEPGCMGCEIRGWLLCGSDPVFE